MVDCGFRGIGCYKYDYVFLNQTSQIPWCKGTHCSGKVDGNGFSGNFCADVVGRNHYIPKRYSITLICASLDIPFLEMTSSLSSNFIPPLLIFSQHPLCFLLLSQLAQFLLCLGKGLSSVDLD